MTVDAAGRLATEARILDLPWGDERLGLALPPSWQVDGVLLPAAVEPVGDVAAAVRKGLRSPIASPSLSELVSSDSRVTVVIDDGSRPTPLARMLPAVLEELDAPAFVVRT